MTLERTPQLTPESVRIFGRKILCRRCWMLPRDRDSFKSVGVSWRRSSEKVESFPSKPIPDADVLRVRSNRSSARFHRARDPIYPAPKKIYSPSRFLEEFHNTIDM